ncbi:hypothetical protein ACFL2J_01825 [Candidatus Omnitrophota bacterium]
MVSLKMKQDSLVFIIFGFSIIAVLVVAVRGNLFQDVDDMVSSLKIGAHNFEYQLIPDRGMPLLVVNKEYGLRQLYPAFFNRLSKADWQEFWDIIYGIHPLINFENKMLAPADRNLSIVEIKSVLVKRYPEIFSGFSAEHWKLFWKEIKGVTDYSIKGAGGDEWSKKQKARSDRRLDQKVKQDKERISSTIQDVRETIGK